MTTRPRGRPAPEDGDAISDEMVLDAVLQAFAENGFEGTSIREVARKLGISHNLIPQRFGSKTDLWYAAVRQGFHRMNDELVREGKRHGENQLTIFRELLIRAMELTALQPCLLQIINQEARRPGPRLDFIVNKYIGPAHDFLETWAESLAAEGHIRRPPVGLIYFLVNHGAGSLFVFHGLADRLGKFTEDRSSIGVRKRAERVIEVFFEGLLVR